MAVPYKSYQEEQSETLSLIVRHLKESSYGIRSELRNKINDYLAFREEVDYFHSRYLGDICTIKCYKSHLSACCSKEGIITFFADVVVNVIMSDQKDIDPGGRVCLDRKQGFISGKLLFINDHAAACFCGREL